MSAIWLIAVNYLREQRLVLYVLLGWLAAYSVIFMIWPEADHREHIIFFRQFAAYAVALTVLTIGQGFRNDRKTRRMIAVLAKGITRSQFLAGYVLGSALFSAIFLLAVWLVQIGFSARAGFVPAVAGALLAVWIASVLAAVVALIFATFLPPLLVSIISLLVLALPAVLAIALPGQWSILMPVGHVGRHLLTFEYARGWTGGWTWVFVAVVQGLLGWLIAAAIFHRQDVTAAVE
jgi:hypothetical protein